MNKHALEREREEEEVNSPVQVVPPMVEDQPLALQTLVGAPENLTLQVPLAVT